MRHVLQCVAHMPMQEANKFENITRGILYINSWWSNCFNLPVTFFLLQFQCSPDHCVFTNDICSFFPKAKMFFPLLPTQGQLNWSKLTTELAMILELISLEMAILDQFHPLTCSTCHRYSSHLSRFHRTHNSTRLVWITEFPAGQ